MPRCLGWVRESLTQKKLIKPCIVCCSFKTTMFNQNCKFLNLFFFFIFFFYFLSCEEVQSATKQCCHFICLDCEWTFLGILLPENCISSSQSNQGICRCIIFFWGGGAQNVRVCLVKFVPLFLNLFTILLFYDVSHHDDSTACSSPFTFVSQYPFNSTINSGFYCRALLIPFVSKMKLFIVKDRNCCN